MTAPNRGDIHSGDTAALLNEGPVDAGVAADLYRREALAAATSRFGAPVRPMGLNAAVLTGFMFALFIAVVLFLAIGRYARKETVAGVIQPSAGAARVATLTSGVISDVFVVEGQAVKAGAPLFKFSSDPSVASDSIRTTTLSSLITAGAEREAQALAEQAEAQVQEKLRALEDLRARETGLREDQVELEQSLELQHERIRLTRETLEAGRSLHERQLFSALQLRQREEAFIAAQQGARAMQREMKQNSAALAQMQAEAGRLRAQMSQAGAEMQRVQAQFDQRRAEQVSSQATVLVAGRSGRVAALQARPGALAQAGQALAVILPDGAKLQAELWVPSRAAGFVQVGAPVRLMYDAFPYQKFGVGRGRVRSIAGAPTNPADLPVPIETMEALYRVVVEIESEGVQGYGREWRLTPGMKLSADVILEERTMWEWLFDPIIAARRRSGA